MAASCEHVSDAAVTLESPVKYFKANKSGEKLSSKCKQIILNVYSSLRDQNPQWTVEDVVSKTAQLTGVSVYSVYTARAEFKLHGKSKSPAKGRPASKGKRVRVSQYSDFILSGVRRKVHSFFLRNELPTVKKVTSAVNSDPELPNFSESTIRRLMTDLGFIFKRRDRASALLERADLIQWRHKYLRSIKEFRKQKRTVYYLDETWCNAGHTSSKVWQDSTIKSKRQAFISGVSTGLKAPSGKGGRVIIVHCGNENGFVDGAGLVFRARKSSGDYHQEMDGPRFEAWFKELLPKLQPNSVIVMDNASYHSVKLERIPTASSKKSEMQKFLKEKGVNFEYSWLKAELVGLIQTVKHKYEGYRIDSIAELAGHTVLRLPPYHCELNPIELIWSQVKGYVARNNTTFKLHDVERLLQEGIAEVTPENWESCVRHVMGEEKKLWDLDFLMDGDEDKFVINVNGDSDNESSSGSLSGIEEMDGD